MKVKQLHLGWLSFFRLGWVEFYKYKKIKRNFLLKSTFRTNIGHVQFLNLAFPDFRYEKNPPKKKPVFRVTFFLKIRVSGILQIFKN